MKGTEYMKIKRFNSKVMLSILLWFNIQYLFTFDMTFGNYNCESFKFWATFNLVLIGYIVGIEKPKTSKGVIGLANDLIEVGRKVKNAFREVDEEVGIFRDRTTIHQFSKEKPNPIDEKEKKDLIEKL